MRYRRLNENNDYVLGSGNFDFLTDIDAFAQAIKTKLQLLLGEWWEDLSDGLPLFQSILGQTGNNKNNIDLLIQKRILETPNIKKIQYWESSLANRIYTFYATIDTVYGYINVVSSSDGQIFVTT